MGGCARRQKHRVGGCGWLAVSGAIALSLLMFWVHGWHHWVLEFPAHKTGQPIEVIVLSTKKPQVRVWFTLDEKWRAAGPKLQVVLRDNESSLPYGTVVFADTTVLPGTFMLRLGDKTLRIQKSEVGFVHGDGTVFER